MDPAGTPKYWFPAKRYGWGWGLPCTWQGWVVFVAYLALIFGGWPLMLLANGVLIYFVYSAVLTAAFVVICRLRGEPPRWRWGDRDE